MHFEGMNPLDARHLVLAYVAVALIQGAYFVWVLRNWLNLHREQKKAAKPIQ
jgi:ABC-type arginine transport system permease subunit